MTTLNCSEVPGTPLPARHGTQACVTEAWVSAAVERCLQLCRRSAPRYVSHLRRTQHCRDPLDDLLVLAARRQVALSQRVVRPLPGATLPSSARAFNALDRADRRVLLALMAPSSTHGTRTASPSAARGEHLASALARLVEGTRARERPGPQKKPRPPP